MALGLEACAFRSLQGGLFKSMCYRLMLSGGPIVNHPMSRALRTCRPRVRGFRNACSGPPESLLRLFLLPLHPLRGSILRDTGPPASSRRGTEGAGELHGGRCACARAGALRMREDGRPGILSSSAVTPVPSAPERIAGKVGPRRSVGGAAALRGWSGRPGAAPEGTRSRGRACRAAREGGRARGARGARGSMSQQRPARRLPSLLVDPAQETVRRRCRDPINVESLLVSAGQDPRGSLDARRALCAGPSAPCRLGDPGLSL